ncbi:hypothetical protein [Phormidium tenue]|nr:hypothetical protein [Phormidium tenue]
MPHAQKNIEGVGAIHELPLHLLCHIQLTTNVMIKAIAIGTK